MDPTRIRDLLERVRANRLGIDEALRELRHLPYRDLGFANVDHHRHLRTGFPEVILGEGKTAPQIVAILREIARGGGNCLVTRVAPDKARTVLRRVPRSEYHEAARAMTLVQRPIEDRGRGLIVV